MEHLYDRLKQYAQGEDYPFHMPGHKRRAFGEMPPEAISMDVTEIDGFDDLHAPEGILKELQERIARLYGAEESFCLVGGSTAGILSALSAALPEGGHLILARNCHKSAYHAAYLRNLKLTYLVPPVMEEFGICGAITPAQVRDALMAAPDASAVLITSPTYEGRISQVREIAEVVHEFGKILIVDEAHGAHLGILHKSGGAQTGPAGGKTENCGAQTGLAGGKTENCGAPNSCQAGADLVIHSVHKTLPAMTQTALLHVNGDRVDRERLRRFLRIYQSSSPSYVLMASIDNAVTMMEEKGEQYYKTFLASFTGMVKELEACRRLRFLAAREEGETGRQDLGKLVIHAGTTGLSGQEIYDLLREKWHLQLEMAAGQYCLAMFTVGDTPEGYRRMRDALLELDESFYKRDGAPEQIRSLEVPGITESGAISGEPWTETLPEAAKSLGEAWDAPWEEVPVTDCAGRIAAEFVYLYPPGTPLTVPGEIYEKSICEVIQSCIKQGLRLRGVSKAGTVRCLKA